MRVGPVMRWVVSLVERHPGQVKKFYAEKVGPHGSLRFGYAGVNRAIEADLVRAQPGSVKGTTVLFPHIKASEVKP